MDLKLAIPDAMGLSISNMKYARYFFELYSEITYRPQRSFATGCCRKRALRRELGHEWDAVVNAAQFLI